jgi:hypothetical protein
MVYSKITVNNYKSCFFSSKTDEPPDEPPEGRLQKDV